MGIFGVHWAVLNAADDGTSDHPLLDTSTQHHNIAYFNAVF